jgi:hypothetical protein
MREMRGAIEYAKREERAYCQKELLRERRNYVAREEIAYCTEEHINEEGIRIISRSRGGY